MKANLESLFKTDTSLEKDGVWFTISEETKFLIRRFGGSNHAKIKLVMAKYHKPKARLIELGQLPDEEVQTIMIKVFAEACLVSWQGVELDGEDLECNSDNALKLFTRLPELFDSLFKYSQGFDSFKEDLGNS